MQNFIFAKKLFFFENFDYRATLMRSTMSRLIQRQEVTLIQFAFSTSIQRLKEISNVGSPFTR